MPNQAKLLVVSPAVEQAVVFDKGVAASLRVNCIELEDSLLEDSVHFEQFATQSKTASASQVVHRECQLTVEVLGSLSREHEHK